MPFAEICIVLLSNELACWPLSTAEIAEHAGWPKLVNAKAADVYRYMTSDQIPEFVEVAATVEM